jgi:hypothetical protein
MALIRYEWTWNQSIVMSEVDKIAGLIAQWDIDNDTVLWNIENNKHLPWFLSTLQNAIRWISKTKTGFVGTLSEVFREDQAYNNLSKITDSTVSVTKALDVVKNEIASYYQMIFNNIEWAKNNSNKPQISNTTALWNYTPQNVNSQAPSVDMHFVENFFVWKDPLFWTALFLYQKELNYANKQSSLNSKMALMTHKCYQFLQQELQDKEDVENMRTWNLKDKKRKELVEGYSSRRKNFLLLQFEKREHKDLEVYKIVKTIQFDDINTSLLNKFKNESQKRWKLADKLRSEYNWSERIFHEIRKQAQWAIEDKEIIRAIRESVSQIWGKFYTKQLNPFDADIKDMRWYENLAKFLKEYISNRKENSDYQKDLDIYCQMNSLRVPNHIWDWDRSPESDLVKTVELIREIKKEKETLSKYITSPTINNESEFFQTMTQFAHNNHLQQVRWINLATAALWLNSTTTLKWLVDRLSGRIAKDNSSTYTQDIAQTQEESTNTQWQYLLELPAIDYDLESMQNAQRDLWLGENDLWQDDLWISIWDLDLLTEEDNE